MPHDAAMNNIGAEPPATAAGGVLSRTAFRSTFDNVRLAIENAISKLKPLHLSDEDLSSVEIVLAEALNNIVEHAYPPEHPGDVKLILRHGRAGLLIEIRDEGKPMPNGRTPVGDHPADATPQNSLPEGGYGWFLIKQLARDMVYDRENGENFLIFRISLGEFHNPEC